MKLFNRNTLNPFDWFLIAGIIILNLAYSLLAGEFDLIGSLAGITGVVCVVLVAKRNIANYLFGIINVSLYAYISFKSQIYGDMLLNAVYYLPMQFIGWFAWMKRRGAPDRQGRADQTLVKTRRMNGPRRIALAAGCTALILACGYALSVIPEFSIAVCGRSVVIPRDPQPYKDAATTILSVTAMLLMVRTFMEQWVIWVVVNTISVIMWIIVWMRGDAHAALMVIMWIFYLANSLNGLRIWNRSANAGGIIES